MVLAGAVSASVRSSQCPRIDGCLIVVLLFKCGLFMSVVVAAGCRPIGSDGFMVFHDSILVHI